MKIKIDHIDKIEGHMGFEASLYRGDIKSAFLDVLEGARMIEGVLRGRPFHDVPIITSRICGVCPVVHNLASIKAIEDAMDIKVDKLTVLFRKLMLMGEMVQSHVLHVVLLAGPDFLGTQNDIELIAKYPKEAELTFQVRDFSVDVMTAVGGRSVHPIASEVGGFKILPERSVLEGLLKRSDGVLRSALAVHNFLAKNIKLPDFSVEFNPIAYKHRGEYAFYDGKIVSGKGMDIDVHAFYDAIAEMQSPGVVVKQTEVDGGHYQVSALARLLIQGNMLNKEAYKLFKKLPREVISKNPFYNLFAQSVEVIHCLEEIKKLLKQILGVQYPKSIRQKITPKAGEGVGSVEAPRGILLHHYKIDKAGKILESNIMTPTVQFLNDMEHSIKAYLPDVINLPEKERALKIKSLVRAYDPCISCATH